MKTKNKAKKERANSPKNRNLKKANNPKKIKMPKEKKYLNKILLWR